MDPELCTMPISLTPAQRALALGGTAAAVLIGAFALGLGTGRSSPGGQNPAGLGSPATASDNQGQVVPEANPNGSIENIAGICNRERNVFGLMPHPDRASDAHLGSADGAKIFLSMMETIRGTRSTNAAKPIKQVA
jgi:hypothetical protein